MVTCGLADLGVAAGRMVSRTDGHGNTAYFYDGGNVLLAHPTHGSTYLASEYLPGANGQIAGIDRLNGSGVPLQSASFYPTTLPWPSRWLTSQGGNGPTVPTASSWDAWGNPAGLTDSDDTYGLPLGYLGLPYDQEAAGLTWAHARWYDASQGRMLSRDPLGGGLAAPASQNRYAYALDNPTTFMDPSGMSTIQKQLQFQNGALLAGLGVAAFLVSFPDNPFAFGVASVMVLSLSFLVMEPPSWYTQQNLDATIQLMTDIIALAMLAFWAILILALFGAVFGITEVLAPILYAAILFLAGVIVGALAMIAWLEFQKSELASGQCITVCGNPLPGSTSP